MPRYSIKIVNILGDVLEEVELKTSPDRLIMYRGRLLERLHYDKPITNEYIERSYLEIT